MSGLFSSLGAVSSTLQAHSKSIEQAGRNLANINNPAYARQGVHLASSGAGSIGLTIVGFEHARDTMLDRQILSEISMSAGLEAKYLRLNQVLTSVGEGIDRAGDAKFIDEYGNSNGGLRNSIDAFFNSFETFAARPTDAASKHLLLEHARNVAASFNQIDARLSNMQNDLDREITIEVDSFNRRLEELDTLNQEIAKFELTRPGSALDLRDQRQAKLEELAAFGDFRTWENTGELGQIGLSVTDSDGNQVVLLAPGQPVSRLEIAADGTFEVAGSGEVVAFGGGRLSALTQVRDGYIQDIRAELDLLAATLAGDVNEIYEETGLSFFDPNDLTAGGLRLADDLTVSTLSASASGVAGGNELAFQLAGLGAERQTDLGGMSYSQFSVRIATGLGQEVQSIRGRKEMQDAVQSMVKARRDEVSGVSLDEEVANLMQAQRAFQASARVFNTISELLDSIVNGLGR